MEKSIFEQMGGTYHWEGDYLLPDLAPPESAALGVWGQRRRRFLREHRKPLYTAMLLAGILDAHLSEIDRQAGEMFSRLVELLIRREGITEELKAADQMAWVGLMNTCKAQAEEAVLSELVYD